MRQRQVMMVLTAVIFCTSCATSPAPYAGEQARSIKALSGEDMESLLAGKGMGFAKAAELNGYPGPLHVLELSAELRLAPEQKVQTQALFDAMNTKARSLGRDLVEAERELDRLFATRAADAASLRSALERIAALQAAIRGSHLEAHLAQLRILTPEQVGRYVALRGYGAGGADGHRH